MHGRPCPEQVSTVDCRFARTCISLSSKGLDLRHNLPFAVKCLKVQQEVSNLMSKSTLVPAFPHRVLQQIWKELDCLKSLRPQDFLEICEVFSPLAWLKLGNSERSTHQLLSRPCYACIQHNTAVYYKFVGTPPPPLTTPHPTTPRPATPPPTIPPPTTSAVVIPAANSSSIDNKIQDDLLSQLRELIKPAVEDNTSTPTSSVSSPDKISEQEAFLLAALSALPSATLDKMISILSPPASYKQEPEDSETLVCRTTTSSVFHQSSDLFQPQYVPQLQPQSLFRNQPSPKTPSVSVPQLSPNFAALSQANTVPVSHASHKTRLSPLSSQSRLDPVSSHRPVSSRLDPVSSRLDPVSPRITLPDLTNVPTSGLWIVRICKAMFELSVGAVLNPALIADLQGSPSKHHVSKLAQILGLETRVVEYQEILSGFRMFKNSANFDRSFATQIAKVTLHQLFEGGCSELQLSALSDVITDVIMQAFHLHRDTPPMTVAKVIMIQGSPLYPRTVPYHTQNNNKSSTSRKRRKVHSGASKQAALRPPLPEDRSRVVSLSSSASSVTSNRRSSNPNESGVMGTLVSHLSDGAMSMLKTEDNLSYGKVADFATAVTDALLKKIATHGPGSKKEDGPTEAGRSDQSILLTTISQTPDSSTSSSVNVRDVSSYLNEMIASLESDGNLVGRVEHMPTYSQAVLLGKDVGDAVKRVELLYHADHLADTVLTTTSLLGVVNHLSSASSTEMTEEQKKSGSIQQVVNEVATKDRRFLCGLITTLTLPHMAVSFVDEKGAPNITLKTLDHYYYLINMFSKRNAPLGNGIATSTANNCGTTKIREGCHMLVTNSPAPTVRLVTSLTPPMTSSRVHDVIDNADDDMEVANTVHFLVSQVVQNE